MAKAIGGFTEALSNAGTEAGRAIKNAMVGRKTNGTYKAINHISNNYLGGVEYVTRGIRKGDWGMDNLSKTFTHQTGPNKGKVNIGKIAGSYIGVSAAARVATGGGLYKDRNGNTNIAGVPFI